MPQNKRESLIYTVLMCFVMVYGMSVYNIALHGMGELRLSAFSQAWMGLPPAYVIALLLDLLVASRLVKYVAFAKILHPQDPAWKKILVIASGMVIVMCTCMSLYGAVETCARTGQWSQIPFQWLQNLPWNFVMAWPLQMAVAGPLVRKVFRTAFPEGTVQ